MGACCTREGRVAKVDGMWRITLFGTRAGGVVQAHGDIDHLVGARPARQHPHLAATRSAVVPWTPVDGETLFVRQKPFFDAAIRPGTGRGAIRPLDGALLRPAAWAPSWTRWSRSGDHLLQAVTGSAQSCGHGSRAFPHREIATSRCPATPAAEREVARADLPGRSSRQPRMAKDCRSSKGASRPARSSPTCART